MIQTATDGTITHIHYNASGQRIAESDNDGNVLREYIYLGQQAIALTITNGDSKTTYFIHNDHLGTPKLLTGSSGTVVWQQHTTPFGEITDTLATGIENLKSLPGQYRDSETGYSYNYFRDYDPSLGRYIQSDPIGLNGGLNTYGYVGGNPIKYLDQFGLESSDYYVAEDYLSQTLPSYGLEVPDVIYYETYPLRPLTGLNGYTTTWYAQLGDRKVSISDHLWDRCISDEEAFQLFETFIHEIIHYNQNYIDDVIIDKFSDETIHPTDGDDWGNKVHQNVYRRANLYAHMLFDDYNRHRKQDPWYIENCDCEN